MVEPYESRRQKKPTGAVKPINYLGNATTRPYGQSMPTMRPMDPGIRAVAMASAMRHPWQPNISMPARPATPVQAAPTPQPRAVPWGSAAVANSGNVPGVTVPIVQTMPFQQWTQQQIASGPMNPGLPWAGSSGISRPTQAETLRDKAPETAKKVKERSIAGRAKRNEGLLPEGSRRALVTAKAQGRRISPVQAGVEASMAAGNPLSDDQKAMMFGPAFAEIQARNEASRMAALASILAPGEFPQSPVVSNWAMGQLQGMMPGGGAMPEAPASPLAKVMPYFSTPGNDLLKPKFDEAVAAGDSGTLRDVLEKVMVPEELQAEVLQPYGAVPRSQETPAFVDSPWKNDFWSKMLFGSRMPSFTPSVGDWIGGGWNRPKQKRPSGSKS